MSEAKESAFDPETIFRLGKELAKELSCHDGDNYPGVIGAMLDTLHEFKADSMDVLKVFSSALLMLAKANDAASGAGAIVAIKLLTCLMPGRPVAEVASAAMRMLKTTANGEDDESPSVRVVIIRKRMDE